MSWGREEAKLSLAFHDFSDESFAVASGGILSCSSKSWGTPAGSLILAEQQGQVSLGVRCSPWVLVCALCPSR